MIIAPSILNANNINLEKEIIQAKNAGINRFHIDIMDGHFVPNLSFGPELVKDFKASFKDELAEIHLMSNNPKLLVPEFVKVGAGLIEIHYEAMDQNEIHHWINYMHENNVYAGLVLNPETPVSVLKEFLPEIDQVLIMTVHPGFGGQKFIPDSVNKIKEAHDLLSTLNKKIDIEVDGGINNENILSTKEAGANIFVVGSYIFKSKNIVETIHKLNQSIIK